MKQESGCGGRSCRHLLFPVCTFVPSQAHESNQASLLSSPLTLSRDTASSERVTGACLSHRQTTTTCRVQSASMRFRFSADPSLCPVVIRAAHRVSQYVVPFDCHLLTYCFLSQNLQTCPFDRSIINRSLPENEAILSLTSGSCQTTRGPDICCEDRVHYYECVSAVKELATLLRPGHVHAGHVSRPMQRKLISLLHCQLVEADGRAKAMRAARSIGERALAEFLIRLQDSHSVSKNLWSAVRTKGCQFLGPAMQEEVLKLVLLALGEDAALSRKVLVMFVVQRLSPHFPHQASMTAIGHVIQLLYRASCFKVSSFPRSTARD